MHRLLLTARGFKPSEAIKSYTEKKIEKVSKLLRRNITIKCEIIKHDAIIGLPNAYEVGVSFYLPKAYIKVEKVGSNAFQAIDEIEPVLQRLVKRYKEKRQKRSKKLDWKKIALNL